MSSALRRKVDILRAKNRLIRGEEPWQTRLRYLSYVAGLGSVYLTVFQIEWGPNTVFSGLREWHDDKMFEWFGILRPGDEWEYADEVEDTSQQSSLSSTDNNRVIDSSSSQK